MDAARRQTAYDVRLEWGPTGAAALTEDLGPGDVAVVVDVLSFTTTLCVAVERGIVVHPFRWRDDRARAYADQRGAVLAVGRLEAPAPGAGPHAVSLSPAAMTQVTGVERLVLPSPNGSTTSHALAASGVTVLGASLRNARAVAAWLEPRVAAGARLALVPAGERWPDGSLRPAVEDLWGAGAVLAALAPGAERAVSPEARLAEAAYVDARDRLEERLLDSASGRELVAQGYAGDVRVAAALDVSQVVPVLRGEAFGP